MAFYAIHDASPKFIFIINLKVMKSSLTHPILSKYFPATKFDYSHKLNSSINFHEYQKFCIVRNPFSRAVSCYYQKCQSLPLKSLTQKTAKLENCHKELLESLNIIRGEIVEIGKSEKYYNLEQDPIEWRLINENFERLLTISFEEYINCLSLILRKKNPDAHFARQMDAFSVPGQNPFYYPSKVFKNTTIIRLENINRDWDIICNKLGKKMTLVKVNTTDKIRPKITEFYTLKTQKLISQLYKVDFKKLGYSTKL